MSSYLVKTIGKTKKMFPVTSKEEYLSLRNTEKQHRVLIKAREVKDILKRGLVQMNYSCIPGEDGYLKDCKTPSNSVGMDIDFNVPKEVPAEKKEAWLNKQMAGVPDLVLGKKDELGLLMLERSATKGYHLVFRRQAGLTQEENLRWASDLLGVKFDKQAKDITRVFFTTTADSDNLLYLDDDLFCNEKAEISALPAAEKKQEATPVENHPAEGGHYPTNYQGIPFKDILEKYWEINNYGHKPTQGDRDTLTYQLACDLRHICGKNADWLDQVIPCYDGFTPKEKRQKIESALKSDLEAFPLRLRKVLDSFLNPNGEGGAKTDSENTSDTIGTLTNLPSMPLGVKDSIQAVGPSMTMPAITAVCPCIGALATGVELYVHGKKAGLNLIAFIAGEFASGKGSIDPIVNAWMAEVKAVDKMYYAQEEEWRVKKRAAKNKKDQPEEPKLPVRCIALNNTVANVAERLSRVDGKHAFSFTPEADTLAQKWKSTMTDFSVMLRESYDGSSYDREARSVDAVNVHIDHLLWNVVMCGTPDALYRVVPNYTDGFQSRIAIARTPDNTFAPLEDKPYILTSLHMEHIQQVAHLLPLMQGELELKKLEVTGRIWLENVRMETMMNDDKVAAKQRLRACVTAQRMVCCLMLCKVCENLIRQYGFNGAEAILKQNSELWKEKMKKLQDTAILDSFNVIADALYENALYYFRDRMEKAFSSRDYAGSIQGRQKRGKNDTIYARLNPQFTFDNAMHQSIVEKGPSVTHNSVRQMLKNWGKQGLVILMPDLTYKKA